MPIALYLEQLATRSYVVSLPKRARKRLLNDAEALAVAHSNEREVEVQYRATVLRAHKGG